MNTILKRCILNFSVAYSTAKKHECVVIGHYVNLCSPLHQFLTRQKELKKRIVNEETRSISSNMVSIVKICCVIKGW